MPHDFLDVLKRRATAETARALTARTQLRAIASLASERGAQVVVLKGGLHTLIDAPLVDLADLDVLVRMDAAHALAAALDHAGYGHVGSSPRHLKGRVKPSAVPIELHVTLDPGGGPTPETTWRRVRRIGETGVWELGAADHLWHVLTHATVDHPDRRGRLRDLLMTATAVGRCAPDDLQETDTRVADAPDGPALHAVLETARTLAAGAIPDDRFGHLAVARMAVLRYVTPAPLSTRFAWCVSRWVSTSTLDRRARRSVWAEVRQSTLEGSAYGTVAALERTVPRLGRAVRVAGRVGRHTLTYVLALPVILTVRRAVRRVQRRAATIGAV